MAPCMSPRRFIKAQKKILAAGLQPYLANRLERGL